jgi:hypothetical protein
MRFGMGNLGIDSFPICGGYILDFDEEQKMFLHVSKE